jgi:hypothetical protein
VTELARLVAAEVVRLLGLPPRAPAEELIDAREVARRHGVERAWVYAHADELGALRLGTGARPRLRFDPAIVRDALARREPTRQRPRRAKPRPRKPRTDVELLPIGPRQTVGSGRAA